jgi:hypothetical protein
MNKVKLRNLFNVMALTDSQVATQIEQLTGQHFTSDLITRAADGRPISAIAADAICKWLSKVMGQEIALDQISDLQVHPLSALPDPAKTEEGRQERKTPMTNEEMLATLKAKGYRVTTPAFQAEPTYQEGDHLSGQLAPKNWRALSNRRVPWPQGVNPREALHELAPFMAYRLLSEQAAARGVDIASAHKIGPDEDI